MDHLKPLFCVFETAAGHVGIAWTGAGILRVNLPSHTAEAAERGLRRRLDGAATPASPSPGIAGIINSIQRYFQGEKTDFSDLPLDLSGQQEFFTRVYAATRQVGWGQTTTYGALAKGLGAGPEAARDVGQAMARNPIPLIIPCHRVLAAGGRVGGFSAPGGSAAKVHMLELEGVHLGPAESTQQSLGL